MIEKNEKERDFVKKRLGEFKVALAWRKQK